MNNQQNQNQKQNSQKQNLFKDLSKDQQAVVFVALEVFIKDNNVTISNRDLNIDSKNIANRNVKLAEELQEELSKIIK